jgi:hypothetical protein
MKPAWLVPVSPACGGVGCWLRACAKHTAVAERQFAWAAQIATRSARLGCVGRDLGGTSDLPYVTNDPARRITGRSRVIRALACPPVKHRMTSGGIERELVGLRELKRLGW